MIIPEDEFNGLFSNLMELQILNSDLLQDFRSRVENWGEGKRKIADVIVKKGPFLKLYTSYVQVNKDLCIRFSKKKKHTVCQQKRHSFTCNSFDHIKALQK